MLDECCRGESGSTVSSTAGNTWALALGALCHGPNAAKVHDAESQFCRVTVAFRSEGRLLGMSHQTVNSVGHQVTA